MSSKYTKRAFQKDLKKLAQLIEEHDKMERQQSSRRGRKQRGGNDDMTSEEHNMESSEHSTQDGGRRHKRKQQKRKQKGGEVNAWSGDWDNQWEPMQDGGKKDKRTFKVVSVGGKSASFGTYTITKDSPIGPGRAATKAASSVCAHITGKTGKHSISPQCDGVKFMLKEKTRGSSQKEYGPYKVVVHKRSPKELKDLEKRFKNFGKGKYKPSHHTATAVLVHHK
jgi:hypothetical protein